MKRLLTLFALVLITSSAARAVEGPPALVDYQGTVLDASGDPIALGTPLNIEMYFRVWSHISDPAIANLIWAEKQVVTVLDGQFSVRLGEGDAIQSSAGDNVVDAGNDDPRPDLLTAFNGTARFLGVSVSPSSVTKPNAEIQPRLAFLSSPFAVVAQTARFAESGPQSGNFETASLGVGTGLNTPIAPLHVVGSAAFGNAFLPDGDNDGNILNIMSGANANGTSNGIAFFENPAGLSMSLGYDGTGSTTTDAMKFYNSSGAAIMTLQNDGKVGIGTTAPVHQLTVKFPNITGEVGISTPGGIPGFSAKTNDGLSNHAIKFRNDGISLDPQGGTEEFFVGNNGYIGIGTTSPKANLDIASSATQTLPSGAVSTAGLTTLVVRRLTDPSYIGFEAPSGNPYVSRLIYSDVAGTKFTAISIVNEAAGTYERGNVGIGTFFPTEKLHVIGNAGKTDGGTSWLNLSDRRLKTGIEAFEPGLDEVMKLKPVRFRYKDNAELGLSSENENIGFIAQEVKEVIPEAISSSGSASALGDPYLQLNADPIHWAVVNAIQELKHEKDAQIETLETRLAQLETLVSEMAKAQDTPPPAE